MQLLSGFLGGLGDGVHCHDLATHVDGLGKGDGAEKHVVDVEGHGVLGDKGHLGGYILAVGPFDGLAGCRILDKIVLIALRGKVETLGRQQLVAVENRQVALVVEIASVEIDSGEVGCESLFLLITGFLDTFARHHELLIVCQSHLPEFLQGSATLENDGGVLLGMAQWGS